MNNARQLMIAWHVYAGDHDERVANNMGVTETQNAIRPVPSTTGSTT
jgi:hypothetical protein